MGNELIGENEGALVAQILETKKELEETKQMWANTNQRNVEIVNIIWYNFAHCINSKNVLALLVYFIFIF